MALVNLCMNSTFARQSRFSVQTSGRGLINITTELRHHLDQMLGQSSGSGLLNVFLQHTSASLIIGENADPSVCDDTLAFFERLVEDAAPYFTHTAEGPDDMSAHLRSLLTTNSLSIPITNGQLALGTWQGVFLFEHRTHPHRRNIVCTLVAN